MKIAFFHNLPSGGALKMLGQVAGQMQSRGHAISLYSFSTADHDFIAWPGSRTVIEKLDFEGFQKFKNYNQASQRIAAMINASDADFVWVDKCRYLSSPTVLRYLQKPYLFYAHEPLRIWPYESWAGSGVSEKKRDYLPRFPLSKIPEKILKIADHFQIKKEDRINMLTAKARVLTNSKYTAAWIDRVYGVKTAVFYPGVDTAFFKAEPSVQKKNEVLSVGRIDTMKGYDFLLDVFLKIPEGKRPVWNIVCDGVDPFFYEKFKKEVRRNRIECRVHRRIPESHLRNLYRQSLWTLCASTHEPFGLVPLESMACGTPVLAMAEGGFQETVLHNNTGFLLPRIASVWAGQIQTCLADRSLTQSFGVNASLRAKAWVSMGDRIEPLMRSYL